jgi:hypothetical protein
MGKEAAPMDKVYNSSLAAIADIPDGASIMFGGFGRAGLPVSLIYALKQHGASGALGHRCVSPMTCTTCASPANQDIYGAAVPWAVLTRSQIG